MNEKPRQVVSISEADLDFFQLAALAEINGSVVIYKDNKPKFKLIDLEQDNERELTEDKKIDIVAARVLKKYRKGLRSWRNDPIQSGNSTAAPQADYRRDGRRPC